MQDIKLNEIVTMNFRCRCNSENNVWVVIRTGADIKIKCPSCGNIKMMNPWDFRSDLVKVHKEDNTNDYSKTNNLKDFANYKMGDSLQRLDINFWMIC